MKAVLLIQILFLCLTLSPAVLALEEKMPKSTPTYDVGFMFHKMAGTTPKYSKWVDEYTKGTLAKLGEEGVKAERRRVKALFTRKFKNFNLKKSQEITISTRAKLEIVPFESRYLMSITLGNGDAFLVNQTPEFDINLVTPNLEEKLKSVISKDDYKDIKKNSMQDFSKPLNIYLVLKLKPVSVDATKPLTIDGKEYWLMLSEFITFEIWDAFGDYRIWRYISFKERQKNLDELRSLFKPEEIKN